MPYSTSADLSKKIDESALIQLTDTTGSGVVDPDKVDRAIRDADAVIDSYVSKVYKTPLAPVPHVITGLSATLAIAGLHRFRSVDSPVWSAAHDAALGFLRKVAGGDVTLEGAVTEPAPADDVSSTVTFNSAERRFSRESLKGM